MGVIGFICALLMLFPKLLGFIYSENKRKFLQGIRQETIEYRAKNIKKIRHKIFRNLNNEGK